MEERAALRLSELADRYVETFGKEYISDGQLDYAVLDDREAVLRHARLPRRGQAARAHPGLSAEHGGSSWRRPPVTRTVWLTAC